MPSWSRKIIARLPQGWVAGRITQSTPGRCRIRLNGVDYHAAGPRFADGDSGEPDALRAARSACNPVMRASFRVLGIKQFMYLQVVN